MKQAIAFFLLVLTSRPVDARTECDVAARKAAAETGVPVALLQAITRAETQHRGAPWPWTINHRGEGQWFETKDQAAAAAQSVLDAGGDLDLGCFQINSRWHGHAFPSVDSMLDPAENARYAARYLRSLHDETGGWEAAVAAYHSRDSERGAAYLDRVRDAHNSLQGSEGLDADLMSLEAGLIGDRDEGRRNRFPLFLAGDPASAGTIVPNLAGSTPLVGAP